MSGYVNYAERLLWDARSFVQNAPLPIQKKHLLRLPVRAGSLPKPLRRWPRLGEKQRSHRLAERAWIPVDKPDCSMIKAYRGWVQEEGDGPCCSLRKLNAAEAIRCFPKEREFDGATRVLGRDLACASFE